MNQDKREFLVSRILAKTISVQLSGTNYYIGPPTQLQKYLAQIAYKNALHDLDFEPHYTRESIKPVLISLGIISADVDEKISRLEKDLDNLKHKLYLNHIDPRKQKALRDAIKATRAALTDQLSRLHCLDHLTVEGYAEMVRICALLSFCLFEGWDNPVKDSDIIERIVLKLNAERATNDELRELARTEPFRSIWNAHGERTFDADATDEQRMLILYSKMYDSVYKSNDPPPDFIVNDDDMLDGWMIDQRKEAERERKTRKSDKKNGPNMDADEIYLFKGQDDGRSDKEFVSETEDMNSLEAKIIKQQRKAALKAKGKLSESELPDIKRDISIQAQQQALDARKRR